MRLSNKTAIVTGAAGGIGSAIAKAFAREGADLCLVDTQQVLAVAEEVRREQRRAIEVSVDVTKSSAAPEIVRRTLDAFGRIDVLVNVAGAVSFGSAEALTRSEWDRMLESNLTSTFLCCQAVIAPMRQKRYGRIINIGSVVGKNGGNARPWIDRQEQDRAANIAYGVAKAGVHAMTVFLAKELAVDGITVNAVAPGPIAVARRAKLPLPANLLTQIPVGHVGQPDDVAEAVLFLATERAGFITAEILDVNGGLLGD